MIERTRNTFATRRRIANIRLIIDTLPARDMDIDDICALLQFSPSGARKYIGELLADSVIEIARYRDATATYLGRAMYRLALDQAGVDEFLTRLEKTAVTPKREPIIKPKFPQVPGRKFHIMGDDAHFAVRIHRAPAVRDPLVAALFGAPVTMITTSPPCAHFAEGRP